jgi:hypothetical protein
MRIIPPAGAAPALALALVLGVGTAAACTPPPDPDAQATGDARSAGDAGSDGEARPDGDPGAGDTAAHDDAAAHADARSAGDGRAHGDARSDGGAGAHGGVGGGGHGHPALAPYAERYAAASAGERAAAYELREGVAATLAAFADPADAVAAGYRAPRDPRGRTAHYLDPSVARSGTVLDPTRPAGLVYGTGGEAPVLLGAFFVAPRGSEVPGGAGDLVTWHSHDPACAAFFATAEAPCVDSRRMLHVWTVGTATLTTRRGRSVEVAVVDPFGAPFAASVERAG